MTAATMAKTSSKSSNSSTSKEKSKKKTKKSPAVLKKEEDAAKHINKALVEKAVAALVKYHNEQAMKKQEDKSALPLLGNESSVQVQFGLEVPPVRPSPKPIRVMVPHPIHKVADLKEEKGLEDVDVCLIVKEESKSWVKEMINEFKEHMGCVKKVLGLESLRKKHAQFAQRRELLHKYDIFMADDRILPMLTSALGKDFVKAKKLPVPIRLTRKEALPLAIQRNLRATYMTLSAGTSISIRAGNTGMPVEKLVDNVVAIAENAVDKIPRKWANIRNIAIKTPESTSLPFYHKTPEELLQIAAMAKLPPAFKDMPKKEDDNEEKGNDEAAEKKRKLAAKSPLVRALKKQKKGMETKNQNNDEQTKSKGKDKAALEKENEVKVDVGETITNVHHKDEGKNNTKERKSPKADKQKLQETVVEEVGAEREKASKPDKKKRRKSEDQMELEDKSSSPKKSKKGQEDLGDFFASKNFKGSKNGYVFKMEKQGLGYYKDVKPVVDKMVLQALFRSAEKGGSKTRSRSKSSGGKRKGRR